MAQSQHKRLAAVAGFLVNCSQYIVQLFYGSYASLLPPLTLPNWVAHYKAREARNWQSSSVVIPNVQRSTFCTWSVNSSFLIPFKFNSKTKYSEDISVSSLIDYFIFIILKLISSIFGFNSFLGYSQESSFDFAFFVECGLTRKDNHLTAPSMGLDCLRFFG